MAIVSLVDAQGGGVDGLPVVGPDRRNQLVKGQAVERHGWLVRRLQQQLSEFGLKRFP